MISRTIELAGQHLHYADFGGQGPIVVMVHGLGGSHLNWTAVAPELSKHARVLALDLPGFGLSGRSPKGHALPILGEALVAFIAAVSPDGPVHLVGNSMGGALSVLAGHAHRDRVASLLLVCPALPPPPGRPRIDSRWMGTMLLACAPGGHRLLRRRATRLGPERHVRELFELLCVEVPRVPAPVLEAHVALAVTRSTIPWIQQTFTQSARSLIAEILFGSKLRDALRRPGPPTLIVQGQRDRLVDPRAARAVVAQNPRIELTELPDVGHVPQLEVPDAFGAIAARWLERVAPRSAPGPNASTPA